ncbi:hypothetical protein HAN_1g43 (nucleomorph) [Hemiselmis andersenii]|uniref:Uncharacterized protein n=2 Tax=Hemiselmis andersenii TaxID=464988 RepID=A9BK55_HEMAN|nr:hypothetical protein HAN_1g43 [Hemiselmis andersenii]ABW97888.1 hypothetical protein HAN_1g43 [Hemiselmis andersenii]
MFAGSKASFLLKNLVEAGFHSNHNKLIFEIIYEIKKTINDLSGILERSKKEKIFWDENPRIVCVILIKKKTIERNIKSLFFFFFHRTKQIELLFWLNNFGFSKHFFSHYFSKQEFKYLNIYNQILNDYFNQIQINLLKKDQFFSETFLSDIILKKNFKIFFNKKKKKNFYKNSKLLINFINIENFISKNFFKI